MQLSIIIPTKDRGGIFEQTLKSALNAIENLNAEIIVVNDSKQSKPIVPLNNNLKLLNNLKAGVASARNTGAKESKGEILLFLDDDIIISKNSIDHILLLHSQISKACINPNWEFPEELSKKLDTSAFGRFFKKNGLNSFYGWYNESNWQENTLFKSSSVASFHLSLSRDDFERSGGYNEQFPHAGFEDYDFPLRLKRAGLTCYIDTRITVHHNESDKMEIGTWLDAQERRAKTRKVAVQLGYKELEIKHNIIKRKILSVFSFFYSILFFCSKKIPNLKFLDPFYFKLISVIEIIKIHRGYTLNKS